jgi:hypothetical protein
MTPAWPASADALRLWGEILLAKGLIRSKRLEDPAFGEYFLIGTLASAALAIAIGLLIRAALAALW